MRFLAAFVLTWASFDENGSLNSQWTGDYGLYRGLKRSLTSSVDSYGAKVNGKLTVSENVADLGRCAAA